MFLYYVCQCCGTRVALAHFRANWSIIYFIKFQYMHLVFSIQGPIFDFIAITFSLDLFKCQVNPLLMANSTQCLPLCNGHAKVMKHDPYQVSLISVFVWFVFHWYILIVYLFICETQYLLKLKMYVEKKVLSFHPTYLSTIATFLGGGEVGLLK